MSYSEKRTDIVVGIISLMALVILAVLGLVIAEDTQRQKTDGSYSRQDQGYCGIYLLLRNSFPKTVSRSERQVIQVFSGEPAVLITTRSSWTKQEQQAAQGWMEQGGVLVLLHPPESEQGNDAGERQAKLNPVWAGFADLPRLSVPEAKVWKAAKEDLPIYVSNIGPEVGVRAVGRGRRVVFSDATMLTNSYLLKQPEAGVALAKLVALYHGTTTKKILWDESIIVSAEPQATPGWWYALLAQLVLLAIIYTVSRGRRLGPPRELSQTDTLSLEDYRNSLAGFYRKTGCRQVVLEELYQELRRRLLRATGCGAGVTDRELAEVLSKLRGIDPVPLIKTLEDAVEAMARTEPDEKRFYAIGKALDRYRKELDQYDGP